MPKFYWFFFHSECNFWALILWKFEFHIRWRIWFIIWYHSNHFHTVINMSQVSIELSPPTRECSGHCSIDPKRLMARLRKNIWFCSVALVPTVCSQSRRSGIGNFRCRRSRHFLMSRRSQRFFGRPCHCFFSVASVWNCQYKVAPVWNCQFWVALVFS